MGVSLGSVSDSSGHSSLVISQSFPFDLQVLSIKNKTSDDRIRVNESGGWIPKMWIQLRVTLWYFEK